MPDKFGVITPQEEELDLGILNHFKTDSLNEVYLKLTRMGEDKRQVIFQALPDVWRLLNSERDQLIHSLLGEKAPRFPQEKWHLIGVLVDSVDVYAGDNQKIIPAINLATDRNFAPLKKQVDWPKFAQKAKQLRQALECFYEVGTFPEVESAKVVLKSFYNTINDQNRLDEVAKKTFSALQKVAPAPTGKFEEKQFLKELLPEFYPQDPLPPEIRQALEAWQFLPQFYLEQLLNNPDRDELVGLLTDGWRALSTLKSLWEEEKTKPTDYSLIVQTLRQEIRFTYKLIDFTDWQLIRSNLSSPT